MSDRDLSADGRAALQINRDAWKHAETEHFIYHFRDEKQAETVYVHAEGYYAWIKEIFGVENDPWKTKCQVYIFEDKALWEEFNKQPGTERLSGAEAYTNGTDLFIHLEPFYLTPQKVLAHEITHIVVHRFLKGTLPLFLNEGFAEFMSYKALALQTGGDEFRLHTVKMIPQEDFISVQELAQMRNYPAKKEIFYQESELVVRYLLLNNDRKKFYELLAQTASGTVFEDALNSIYEKDLETFEPKFRTYAVVSSQK